jgi:Ca2+-binding EF-hand superfamily protein
MTGFDRRAHAGATAAVTSAALIFLSGCAQSPEQPPPFPEFIQADLDHDNSVTREEWVSAGIAKFDALDADHDGTLSGGEIEAARQTLDRNHDGVLAANEVKPGVAALDADNDGIVDKNEFQSGLIENLGGDEGVTSVQRNQVIQQLNRQFDAGAQSPAQAIDYGARAQNASMLHFMLYQFD